MKYELIPREHFGKVMDADAPQNEKMALYADMCRFNAFVSVKKAGSGHLGSSFSAMDIVCYLYLAEMNTIAMGLDNPDRDIYFSSKGHDAPGLYSVFYALGILEAEDILKLRRFGGLDGHPEVRIKGIEANSGSLGMGISKGKGMEWAKRQAKRGGRVFVLTGDGEFQEGQIYESLQSTAHQKINGITVIIDRNKFQTDMLVDDVNSIEDLKEKVASFGWHVAYCKGHDYADIERAFNELREVDDKPKFLIADTIKGKGVSFLETPELDESGKVMYKWHSGAPDDEYFAKGVDEMKNKIAQKAAELGVGAIDYKVYEEFSKNPSGVTKEFVKVAFGDTLVELAAKRRDLVVLDGDLAADCGLRPFEKLYPDRFIENGIAEQDMCSMAGGIAKSGLLPVVNSFASFLASRGNEQIYNNACEETKIIYGMHFAGLIPAGPGKSHQSLRDISLMGAIPNMLVVQPCNAAETKMITKYCVEEAKENCAVRLAIGPSPRIIDLPEDYSLEFGKGVTLRSGLDAIIFAYGPVMLHEALLASEILEENDFGLKVVNMPWLNRIDDEWLKSQTEDYDKIFVLEDHSVFGGLGDQILYSLAKTGGLDGKLFEKFGLDEYPECGTPPEVLGYHRLDGKSLAERIAGGDIKSALDSSENYTADAPQ